MKGISIMIVAIDQPNYLPWKGYFDLIHDVDVFVFYNDVQYTIRDWRSRNKIVTPHGIKWLSVPAGSKRDRLICEVRLDDKSWQRKHFETIKFAYNKAPFFKKYITFFEHVYMEKVWEYLFELDQFLIEKISQYFLGIKTKFADSRDYAKKGAKHEKLLSLLDSLRIGGGTRMSPAPQQKITSSLPITKIEALIWYGKITKAIHSIPSYLKFLHIKSQLSISYLMLEMMPRIISGAGEKVAIFLHIQRSNKAFPFLFEVGI